MNEIKEIKKEARTLRKELRQLSDVILLHLHKIDEIFEDKTIPNEVGIKMAKLSNKLDFKNDFVRHFVLNLGIDKKDKDKAVEKLKGIIR